MYHQKATETVTLTRPQLQAILEIITQIGGLFSKKFNIFFLFNELWFPLGVSRPEPWSEPKPRHRNDNRLTFSDYSENQSVDRQLFHNNLWGQRNEEFSSTTDWVNQSEPNGRASSLVMLNDNPNSNQLLSPTSSNSSKGDDLRADSVMTNETINETNYRRYARINDSEFDWNAFQRKKDKALEYRRALALQYEENKRRKLEEQQKRRAEENRLEARIEEQRNKMIKDYEREQKVIEELRLSAEKRREAVVAAIERTPIIKKRHFLVESPPESQPVAAIKPQTRTKEMSAQTEEHDSVYCDTGTQTDVQLLLHLFNEMNLLSKEKSKSLSNIAEKQEKELKTGPKSTPISRSKKFRVKTNESQEKGEHKRGVWVKKPNPKMKYKTESKSTETLETEGKEEIIKTEFKTPEKSISNIEEESERTSPFRRQSLNISKSSENIFGIRNGKRVMSSVGPGVKEKRHFLPQISARPHSRKKWYSQETFDPKFLS